MTITLDDLRDWCKTAPRDRMNPADDNDTCPYTDENGEHCIVGQFLTDIGIDVPLYGDGSNKEPVSTLLAEGFIDVHSDARDYLVSLQTAADGATRAGDPCARRYAIDYAFGGAQ